jgi:flagellar protein FlaF
MFPDPLKAYHDVEKASLSGRELEAHALTKAALFLQAVRDGWDEPGLEERLEEALRYNQRLWTIFQSEATREDNPLPDDIKSNILTLSVFIDKRTFDILAFPAKQKLDILISINRNIAEGLRGEAV